MVNIIKGDEMVIKLNEIDINLVRKINKDKSLQLKSIPYKTHMNTVYVYAAENKREIYEELNFIYGKDIEIEVVEREIILSLIEILFLGAEDDVDEKIIIDAINQKASDIHFEPRDKKMIIRMRIDGKLRITNIFTLEEHLKIISKLKLQANLDITEKRRPQDGKLTFDIKGKKYDLRLSFTNTIFGEKLVVRVLYGQVFNYTLNSLKMTKEQMEKMKDIIKVNTGLVIFNGPTGSGKSTTLYTILQEINNEDVNITTLEDPVEVIVEGVNQVALNKSIDVTFAEALRSILRQDPDVLMIGEIRDDETAAIAVRAAITGHKVYTTIHTKDSREVFFRLEDMGVKDYFIKDSLVGIISQRLVRTLCDKCKCIDGKVNIDGEIINTYKNLGCLSCNYTGYNGRALVAAVHNINKEVKMKLRDIYYDNSLLTNMEMIQNLKDLLKDGLISIYDYNTFLEMEDIGCNDKMLYIEQSKL